MLTSVEEINDGEILFYAAHGEPFGATASSPTPPTARKEVLADQGRNTANERVGASTRGSGGTVVWVKDEDRDCCSNPKCGKPFNLLVREVLNARVLGLKEASRSAKANRRAASTETDVVVV